MPSIDLSAVGSNLAGMGLSKIISIIVTILVCLIVVRIVTRLVNRLVGKTHLEAKMQGLIRGAVKWLLYIVAGLIICNSLGINTSSLVALLSVASLGITLAAEDILSNIAGGLVILTSHPFSIGDIIESCGTVGVVESISLNHTKVSTPNGQLVLLPNKALSSSQVINYSALGRRRVVRTITASYDAPTADVKAALQDAIDKTPNLLKDPASAIRLSEYGAHSIEYTVFCWCKPADYVGVYADLTENIRDAFAAHNVEMTYDHLNVHIVENRG